MTDETNNEMSLENSSLQSSPDQSISFEHIQTDDLYNENDQENQSDHELSVNKHNSQKQLSNEQQINQFNGQDQSNALTSEEEEEQQPNEINDQDQSNDLTSDEEQPNEVENQDQDQSSFSLPEKEEEEQQEQLNSPVSQEEEQQHSSPTDEEEQQQEQSSSVEEEESPEINTDDDDQQQLKAQRELDDDEIPPAEVRLSPRSSTNLINNDTRPLTTLEDPFGKHQEQEEEEQQFSSIENPSNETTDSSINEHLLTEEKPLKTATLSSFLPDIINDQISQDDSSNFQTNSPNEKEIESNEVNPQEFTTEDFPPLPKTELPVHQIINDEDFPPLSSSNTTDQQQNPIEPPIDILKNKSLFKQILVKGQPNTRPSRSTIVTISYSLSIIDTLTSNHRLIEEISNEKYFVGERDLIPAMDVVLLSMDRGERALIESDVRHCYGEQGCEEKQIPPVTTLHPYKMLIDIELHDWITPIDIQLLPIEERIFWSDKKRFNGNFYYRRQDYKTSLDCYNGASRFLDLELNPINSSTDQNQINLIIEKYIQVQNNLAQTYLLSQKYEECLNATENVLKFDSKNVKALFRQGKALFELGKYQEAIQTLKTFVQIQRTNSNTNIDLDKANEMIQISENKLAIYKKDEREIYKRMFQPSTTTNNQQQIKNNNSKQTVNSTTNWLPYVALGAGALAIVGYVALNKYRKLS